MSDYKAVKEAFVSDNPGASIWSVDLVSAAALSSYVLYASVSQSKRIRPNPLVDYVTIVLPLLLAVTSMSDRSILLNAILLALSGGVVYTRKSPVTALHSNGYGIAGTKRKSKGQWLDESDSDEELAEQASPVEGRTTQADTSMRLRVPAESTSESPVPPLNLDTARKRRHSPSPSTHTHTAIDILPTPELMGSFPISPNHHTYPSSSAAAIARKSQTHSAGGRLPFLSVYRAHMMIMTIHCILAIDFKVFPRILGKCEDYGTSLMDVGVGSFVFSLGIVSTRAFASGNQRGLGRRVWDALRKASPVLALGLVRVIMVKGSDYPEHVTEYGVHWNFFFTLGLLPVFGTLLWPLRRSLLRWSTMGLITTLIHEYFLNRRGLATWVLSPARVGLIGMNKEGLVSFPGYLSIYLLGLATGQHLLRSSAPVQPKSAVSESAEQHRQSHYEKRRTELALELFSYAFAWWLALAVLRFFGSQVSRRLANLPYVLWTAAYNTTFLFFYLLIEITCFSHSANPIPPLLEAINTNGLAVFLAANLLTGLVNLSIRTMFTSDTLSMGILCSYSATVCALAWLGRGMRLKVA